LFDRDDALVKVDVDPAQPGRFAPA